MIIQDNNLIFPGNAALVFLLYNINAKEIYSSGKQLKQGTAK
jgi:hypothetical protein